MINTWSKQKNYDNFTTRDRGGGSPWKVGINNLGLLYRVNTTKNGFYGCENVVCPPFYGSGAMLSLVCAKFSNVTGGGGGFGLFFGLWRICRTTCLASKIGAHMHHYCCHVHYCYQRMFYLSGRLFDREKVAWRGGDASGKGSPMGGNFFQSVYNLFIRRSELK